MAGPTQVPHNSFIALVTIRTSTMDLITILISIVALIVVRNLVQGFYDKSKNIAPVVSTSSIPLLGPLITVGEYGKDPIKFLKNAREKVSNLKSI